MTLICTRVRALLLASLLLVATAAKACPADHTLSVVVPYPAGGSLDATTRMLADAVADRLRRPVLVRNVPGASGALGVREVLGSPADGCTVLAGAINTLVLVPLLSANAGFGTSELRPLAKVGRTEMVVIGASGFPGDRPADLAQVTRAQGRPLSVGHPGNDTVQALALQLLEGRTHAGLLPVPYNGSTRLVADLLGGHLDLAVVALPVATPLVQHGRAKIVATFRARDGIELDSWSGWFVPAGVPAAATAEVTEALLQSLDDEDVRRNLLRLGAPTPRRGEQERFAADIQRSVSRYAKLVRSIPRRPN